MKKTADAVIIGGGCMGASAAFHLARKGVTNVILLEREQFLAMGSTGRNAGGFRHQFSNEANIKLSLESIRFLKNFKDIVGHEIDFHQDGYLFLLSDQSSLESFKRNVELQRRLGVAVDVLGPSEIERLAPFVSLDGIVGGTYCPEDGIADPNGVTQGFAKAAASMGVMIHRETEVTGIQVEGNRVRGVTTARGDIETRTVVNAAGPYAGDIGRMAGVEIPVLPYRRHIFITDPVNKNQRLTAEASDSGRVGSPSSQPIESRLLVIDFETSFYFHREGAGILFGMSDPNEPPGYDMTVRWDFLEEITPIITRRLPLLLDLGIARAWAGLYEMTPDAMPIIGPVESVGGFFQINGFSGHGFQHSPAAGRILADLIVDGSAPGADLAQFSLARFDRDGSGGEVNVV